MIVSRARPIPFCNADHFQYAAHRANAESNQLWNGKGLACETVFMHTPSHLRRNWEMWCLWIYRNLESKSRKEVC